jgi:transcriptional regulator with XRE-family HTH domain
LVAKAEKAIETLRVNYRQRTVEKRLGLSAGYLSKLRQPERAPSAALVGALMVLAAHPEQVDELASLWDVSPPRAEDSHVTSRETLNVQAQSAPANWRPSEPRQRNTVIEILTYTKAA